MFENLDWLDHQTVTTTVLGRSSSCQGGCACHSVADSHVQTGVFRYTHMEKAIQRAYEGLENYFV